MRRAVLNKARRLRSLPAVGKVLEALGPVDLPRPAIVAVIRREIAALRDGGKIPEFPAVLERIRGALNALASQRIQPVLNGTGVLIHTNLGRAPLGQRVVKILEKIASGYSSVELDTLAGQRGTRAAYLEHNLALLCGAPAATVVNNCAAALMLVLRHFSSGERNQVIISRGELVQIGGGFRIPEILEASGAVLRETGTTNQTLLEDYAKAITPKTAMILKVHRSNFSMRGFVHSPDTGELAALARKRRVPFVEDLGSGAMFRTESISGLDHEPRCAEILRSGADLVTFSGDKLLGGPQAGIIAGKAKLVSALKRAPFFRALRCDKLVLSALQTTVDVYLDESASTEIPLLAMLHTPEAELRRRAEAIRERTGVNGIEIGRGTARLGGGTLPESGIPSVTLDFSSSTNSADAIATRFRRGCPPVIGYISGKRFRLDLRTILPRQDEQLAAAIRNAMQP